MKRTALLLSISILATFPVAASEDRSLQQCQSLQTKIVKYTKLRKTGGSATQMESWKKSRRRYEEKYRDGNCYRFGKQLK